MKKYLLIIMVIVLSLSLTGCWPKQEANQTTADEERQMMVKKDLSDDNSLETVSKELDETQLNDFDQDLNDLDQEINQL